MRIRPPRALFVVPLVASLASCGACGKASAPGGGNQAPGQPLETRPANGKQEPAFPGQTRAPFATAGVAFEVQRVAGKLDHPWSLAFLPGGGMLVTERAGRVRLLAPDGTPSAPLAGVPKVETGGQAGLFEIARGPTFATDRVIYFTYAEPREGGNGTAVARARLDREGLRLEDVKVIWRATPTLDSSLHFGGRLVFTPDGSLFVTTGERSILEGRRQAQRLDSAFGKIVRIRPDGSIPADNPFAGRAGALPEIFSIGHRNVQAAALHPTTGALWIVDHGARGGDEINVVHGGRDYGWPTISYGVEYAGGAIGDGITARPGMEQPLYYWDPSIAPCGMAFYTGDLFPAWRGSLLVGALAGKHLSRLTLDGERVRGEERLLADRARIRDVRVGPDGAVYVLTDESDGEILKLVPPRR